MSQQQRQQGHSGDCGTMAPGGDGYETTSSEDDGDYILPTLSPIVDSPEQHHHHPGSQNQQQLIGQQQQHHNQQPSGRWSSLDGSSATLVVPNDQEQLAGDGNVAAEHPLEQPARRRGRMPSKRPCLNKNALMARENRQRKKEYVQRIEGKLQQFQQENAKLNGIIQKQASEIKRLTSEVVYLKNVLSNNTVITTLLKAMNESLKNMYPGSGGSQTIRGRRNFDDDGDGGGAIGSMLSMTNSLNVSPFDHGSPGTSGSQSSYSNSGTGSSSNQSRQQSQGQNGKSFARVPPMARKTADPSKEQDHDYGVPNSEKNVDSIGETADGLSSRDTNTPPEFININDGHLNSLNVSDLVTDIKQQISPNPLSIDFEKQEYSLSDTDFSQLSNFDVDLLNSFDKSDENPLQFDRDTGHLFNEDSLFNSLNKESMLFGNSDENFYIDPEPKKNLAKNDINEPIPSPKSDFGSGGVCLHINSNKVSLEFCSVCYMNSLKTELV